MTVQVLGPGCKRCQALAAITQQAMNELGIGGDIEKVTDYAQMAAMGVMSTPALAIDGTVVLVGQVPDVDHVKSLLAASAATR